MVDALMKMLGFGVEAVLYILIASSVAVVGLAVERTVYFLRRKSRFAQLRRWVAELLQGLPEAEEQIRKDQSVPGTVLTVALDNPDLAPESLQELIEARIIEERENLERGLGFFATMGSNAPFIGLFGTVLGIVKAFKDLSLAETTGPQVVMAGLSEALVATAVGLAVAIPALVLYNVFKAQIRVIINKTTALSKVLVSARIERDIRGMGVKTGGIDGSIPRAASGLEVG